MERNLNWAVLGTGVIANEMAQALKVMGKKLYAVGNRTHEKAVTFAEKYQITKVYDDFHEMFTDPQVDVIYITTPHNTHIEFVREALKNKKHVLCEKSITLNSLELEEALALAKENNVIFAEAMTIWHMPLYKKLWELIDAGKTGTYMPDVKEKHAEIADWLTEGIPALGKVQMIQLNFGSYKEYNMKNRFFNMDLAGGALLDIGVYALSIACSFMDSKPDQILSQVKFAPTGADEQAGILLMNKEAQMATLALSLHSKQPKRAVISCENGYIEIMEYPRANQAVIVEAESGVRHNVAAGDTGKALQYEMEDMEQAIKTGNVQKLRIQDTKDVMDIMTGLRKEWNMKYPGEVW
ncbi:MAG TPA: gfo/Idh/MocA family oxidoreductase [Roseburia sp.]|nr:gfo/Idh/MocA family oxidoreductase [Roseburia sp.]